MCQSFDIEATVGTLMCRGLSVVAIFGHFVLRILRMDC